MIHRRIHGTCENLHQLRFIALQNPLIEVLIQNLSWLRVVVPAYLFSADRASFRGDEGEPASAGHPIAWSVGCSQSKFCWHAVWMCGLKSEKTCNICIVSTLLVLSVRPAGCQYRSLYTFWSCPRGLSSLCGLFFWKCWKIRRTPRCVYWFLNFISEQHRKLQEKKEARKWKRLIGCYPYVVFDIWKDYIRIVAQSC